jgi:hypothetical protein
MMAARLTAMLGREITLSAPAANHHLTRMSVERSAGTRRLT